MTTADKIQQIINDKNSLITALNSKGFNITTNTKLAELIDIVENTDIGGDTPSAEKKTVNFYDYDGTLLHSYTREEALALTELPALPDRRDEGLTCQGWNWTLENIKTELTNREDLDYLAVGANYITTDGATHINITFADKYRNVMPLMFKGDVTIDWGDGNTQTVDYTSATTINHEYATAQSYPAKYTIKLTVNSGTLILGSGSSEHNICGSITNNASNPAKVYSSRIDSVFIGNGVESIGDYTFYHCYSLASISIPDSVKSINSCAFYNCSSLASISIPDGVSIGTYAFTSCYSLTSISIPNSVTSIGTSAFSSCFSLASVTIPNGVTGTGGSAFYGCYSLASVTIPNGVESIDTNAFYNCYALASITIPDSVSSISTAAFYNCYSLASISIPNSVTRIAGQAFNNCFGIIKYDFSTHTSIPTLASATAFTGIASDAKIVVPDDLYDDWITTSNWSTYVDYIVKASEYVEIEDVLPTITSLIDTITAQSDTITSMGTFMVAGTLLTWDTTATDEGWFIIYEGIETKCTVIESTTESVVLSTNQVFSQADEIVTLLFRTRMGENTLRQITYPNTIRTAL